MGNRFVVLSVLTSVFQVICALALIIGILLALGGFNAAHEPVPAVNNPFLQPQAPQFAQIGAGIVIWAGAILALYGLAGLVFSGGVHVLISIDQNTHSLAQNIPAAMNALQRSIAASSTAVAVPPQAAAVVAPKIAQQEEKRCAACGSTNAANGRFCENCGEPLG